MVTQRTLWWWYQTVSNNQRIYGSFKIKVYQIRSAFLFQIALREVIVQCSCNAYQAINPPRAITLKTFDVYRSWLDC